jgi:hypothetical protein
MIDLERMTAKVKKPLGIIDGTDNDITSDDVVEALNISFWEVQDKFYFREKECTGTFPTIIGDRNYEMPQPFDCLRSLAVVDPVTFQHIPIVKMDITETEKIYTDTDAARGMPRKYLRENCYARLWPTPDKIYTIVIRKLKVLADLAGDADEQPLPQVWTEVIIYGAIWRLFLDIGDIARSNAYRQTQVALMDSIVPVHEKELKDTPYAGLEVAGRDGDWEPAHSRQWGTWNERP